MSINKFKLDYLKSYPQNLFLSTIFIISTFGLSSLIINNFIPVATYENFIISNIILVIISLSTISFKFNGEIKLRILIFVTILVLIEELLINSVFTFQGIALAFFGVIVLPIIGIKYTEKNETVKTVLEIMGLMFLTRIVFSPFPINLLQSAGVLPFIYTLIIFGIVLYVWLKKLVPKDIGLSIVSNKKSLYMRILDYKSQILSSLFIGFSLGAIEYVILKPTALTIGPNPLQNFIYVVLTMLFFVGLTEELLFRGLLQGKLEKIIGRWQAIQISSLLFGLFHIGWLNPTEVVFAYFAGVVFGYMYSKTKSLLTPVLAHGFGNIMLYTLALILV